MTIETSLSTVSSGDQHGIPNSCCSLHAEKDLHDMKNAEKMLMRRGNQCSRSLIVELCKQFYHLGWVSGTGGGISIKHGDRIYVAPSGVQKERILEEDMFVLNNEGTILQRPADISLKPSACTPLFMHAYTLRGAGAVIHTHSMHAMLCTLMFEKEFRITHQEMIKGISGHGYHDTIVVPIIENTAHESDLADSLYEAMVAYPKTCAVLVRRHGVYIWGKDWVQAKTQAECYDYLFEAAVEMQKMGLDPAALP
eukprot:CAMPEP_0196655822 /NCGR_PEP_ID=MMETSP1086-20130531/8767_1 /TAXON_ID=77921 /ORGANISM="Cyanoptyche  gloeocystis , Strain SAG4.97" /LENGTH=252 /DNA_ID=CAMNT_0041988325 /DNA_START=71 /DNA_END=829 /DNA_ORIENTATION=+